MPINYTFNNENHTLIIEGTGALSLEERIECVRRIFDDESLNADCIVIVRLDQIANYPDAEDVERIASLVARLKTKFKRRIAIVNSRAGLMTTAALVSAYVSPDLTDVCAFFGENEALKWLTEESPSVAA